jgi:DNA-binding PadR family transcriptional regulator
MLEVLIAVASGHHQMSTIAERVRSRSGHRSGFSNSVIYTALRRLHASGAVAETPPTMPRSGQSSIARSYALSIRGRAIARQEIERLESVLRASRAAGLVSERRSPAAT